MAGLSDSYLFVSKNIHLLHCSILHFRIAPQIQNERIKIAYCTDMDKSVLISNFEKRNWNSVGTDDDWNFYWASTTTCRNIFSVENGYRMQDNQY